MKSVTDIHDVVADLKASGEAFALATVVRTVSVTSAKAGAKAVVRSDGTVTEGWIGGGCALSAVQKAAKLAIRDGVPRLISLQPEDLLDERGVEAGETKDGVNFARNMCPSQGTMDIFIEPITPLPELVIFGASPVAAALCRLAAPFGFSRTICAEPAEQDIHGEAEKRIDGFNLPHDTASPRFIVVSTQGRGDEAALHSALLAEAEYVGFVGSRKKADRLKEKLSAKGVSAERLARFKAPAGLDIDAITPEEIALSILAEIVQCRRKMQYSARVDAKGVATSADGKTDGAGRPASIVESCIAAPKRLLTGLVGATKQTEASTDTLLLVRGPCC